MPLFYFDTDDGRMQVRGEEGLNLPDLDAALAEAVDALPDLARDALSDGGCGMIVRVRDEAGKIILTATLTLAVEWAGARKLDGTSW